MFSENVCLHCGACCAYFRVSFYWGETDPARGGNVPSDLVEEETEFYDNMKGTNQSHPYCSALSGKIGDCVGCTIYSHRPSPCSEFGIHYKHGMMRIDAADLERCNKARAAWNLPPLTMESLAPAVPFIYKVHILENAAGQYWRRPVNHHPHRGSGSNHPPTSG